MGRERVIVAILASPFFGDRSSSGSHRSPLIRIHTHAGYRRNQGPVLVSRGPVLVSSGPVPGMTSCRPVTGTGDFTPTQTLWRGFLDSFSFPPQELNIACNVVIGPRQRNQ